MNDFGDTKENDNQENQDAEAQEDTDPSYQTLSRSKSFCVLSICSWIDMLICSWIDMLICQLKLLVLEITNIIIMSKISTRSWGIKRGASRSNAACKGTRCQNGKDIAISSNSIRFWKH